MAITPLPPAPAPSDTQPEFNTKAFTLVSALNKFVTETNATARAVDADAATATAQAGIATEQAAIATTKASEASASATQALNSANAAAASALEAAGLVEKYQGALAADPTLDKNGNPLTAGDWYINTNTGFVRAYNGSAWVQGISVVAGVSSINGLVGDLIGFVTETGAQVLTNKTLVDPVLTLGGTNGTAGQVPISQGTGLPPVWGDVANAATATKLQTARTLTIGNTGKSFDGSANVSWSLAEIGVPAKDGAGATGTWGISVSGNAAAATKLQTARTLTIGNTGKSFDGSANVSWSLEEIGAARFGVIADGTDLNTAVVAGFYRLLDSHGNAPGGVAHGQLIVARGGGGDTIFQIVTGYTNREIYWRQGNPPDVGGPGTWSPWYKFYHSGNLRDTVEVISTNTTAVASRTYVLTASLTLTLPATPTVGDWVTIVNRSGTTTPIVARNGNNIMGLAEDMILDNTNATLRLVFAGGSIGWVLN